MSRRAARTKPLLNRFALYHFFLKGTMKKLLIMLILSGCAGPSGSNGQSCSIKTVSNGALITCGNSSSVILNGLDGVPSAYDIVGTIDVCGKQTSFDEVLLRLGNGELLAHYSSGSNQYLTIVGPGSWVTTDSTSCHFTVDNNLTVTDQLGNIWQIN